MHCKSMLCVGRHFLILLPDNVCMTSIRQNNGDWKLRDDTHIDDLERQRSLPIKYLVLLSSRSIIKYSLGTTTFVVALVWLSIAKHEMTKSENNNKLVFSKTILSD